MGGHLREPLRELAECGLSAALEAMGERWSFMILRAAFNGLHHFEEFQAGGDAYGTMRNWWGMKLEFPLTNLLPAMSFRCFGLSSLALRAISSCLYHFSALASLPSSGMRSSASFALRVLPSFRYAFACRISPYDCLPAGARSITY